MRTIGQIKALIAAYLKNTPADYMINGVDIMLLAINDVRFTAEKLHDFRFSECSADLSVVANGTNLSEASILESGGEAGIMTEGGDVLTTEGGDTLNTEDETKKIKRIRHVMLPVSDGYIPIEYMTDDEWFARMRRQGGRTAYDPASTLAELGVSFRNPTAYQRGQKLYLAPAYQFDFAVVARLDVIRFMPDYMEDTDHDFFCDFGPEYLQWAAILELNKKWKDFIPRLEGNVDEDAIGEFSSNALSALIQWDTDIARSSSTPVIIPMPTQAKVARK